MDLERHKKWYRLRQRKEMYKNIILITKESIAINSILFILKYASEKCFFIMTRVLKVWGEGEIYILYKQTLKCYQWRLQIIIVHCSNIRYKCGKMNAHIIIFISGLSLVDESSLLHLLDSV